MPTESPIWPARLDHLRLDAENPTALAAFYGACLGLVETPLTDDTWLMERPGRRLVIGPGANGGRAYHAYRLENRGQLEAVRAFIAGQGINMEASPSLLFGDDAVCVRDPDGWLNIFGLPRPDRAPPRAANAAGAASLSGRLQHVVVASPGLDPMMDFYENALGLVASDYVVRDEADPASKTVAFYRSDPEHHSFAVFAADGVRADHHAYETSGWMDIRDWADHLAGLGVEIWWGPGRHGPGNNLFFMFLDPNGDQIEISAELEVFDRTTPPRIWPHDEKTLNLWGKGWMRA
jgi:catechol 2,3-dioxygenase